MTEADVPVITVDGPGGTGKGTVCSDLAARLGWHLLDSGALYRALALAVTRAAVDPDDAHAAALLAGQLNLRFLPAQPGDLQRALLDGQDVTEALRSEECGSAASRLAALPAVREALLGRQRDFRRPPGLVADGRDMGTVVFPGAALKIFLTASPEERARRRHKQLKEKGISVSLPRLSANIAERDNRDSDRNVSPLRPAPDAIVIDTTSLDPGEVRKRIAKLVSDKFPGVRNF